VAILLLMALGSLSVAFWAFSFEDSSEAAASGSISQAQFSSAASFGGGSGYHSQAGGQSVSVEGRITELKMTKSGGHLMLRLEGMALPVFVPSSSGAERLAGLIKEGDTVKVTGSQKEYQGSEEIEVARSTDVQKLN